jgi:prepilin-type N-terminal cleavage/methylation domain-containing protein
MQMKLNTSRKGFTLVEIMIVVAIIALLAAIAVPSFLRARKRSQATATLETLRMLDGAKDQYAIENGKSTSTTPAWSDLAAYVKSGSTLYFALSGNSAPNDALGFSFTMNPIDTPPQVNSQTKAALSDVLTNAQDFWGSYY